MKKIIVRQTEHEPPQAGPNADMKKKEIRVVIDVKGAKITIEAASRAAFLRVWKATALLLDEPLPKGLIAADEGDR